MRALAGLCSFWKLQERIHHPAFSAPRDRLHALAHSPSSTFEGSSTASLCPASPSFSDSCDYSHPTRMFQDSLPSGGRSVTSIPSSILITFARHHNTVTGVGIRLWTSVGELVFSPSQWARGCFRDSGLKRASLRCHSDTRL